jgi:hypothetical protein
MSTRIADLTTEELRTLVHNAVREAMREMMAEAEQKKSVTERPPLDVPVLDVGPWPEGLELISREEMYGDDGR